MDLSSAERIVVVGGGQAGAQAVQSLRQGGYRGGLTLVCGEDVPPYQRPPLSKAYMKGELDTDRLFFRPASWYAAEGIDLKLGVTARNIDRSALTVTLSSGETLAYDALILATGSTPRKLSLPGSDLKGVYDLRGLADADALKPLMMPGARIVIIGAGYIGLEAAAVARQIGLTVTVLELAERVLARVTSPVISEFFTAVHRANGVDVLTGIQTRAIRGAGGRVTGVELADGRILPADLVLAGIGITPADGLAREAGLACSNGILTDRDARTCDPRIFAAGDCAHRPLVHYGRSGRLESVHNAIEQGKLAAAAILGLPRPAEDCPWFWSDQYDLKLQIAGLSQGYDELSVRGDPASRRFAVFYLRAGAVIAADAVNSAPDFLTAKRLIAAGARIAPARLQDTSIPIKDIAALHAA